MVCGGRAQGNTLGAHLPLNGVPPASSWPGFPGGEASGLRSQSAWFCTYQLCDVKQVTQPFCAVVSSTNWGVRIALTSSGYEV